MKTNFLIVGSGIAGLSLAIKLSERFPNLQITIATKSREDESNTRYAQGGIAVVQHIKDSFEKHIEDTLISGDGLCDEDVVRMVVENGPQRLQELIDWGADFDRNSSEFDLGKEGGHSENRVVHSKDQTGFEIERALLAKVKTQNNVQILEHHFAVDLIVKENQCLGAYILNEKTNDEVPFLSEYTILATGGIGRVYGHTTNPKIATADGIAMANRAGAFIQDMEFVQFHPTALYKDVVDTTFLISEAVRGFGAHLRTRNGERFMTKYDHRGDLASRDIVSQSIYKELKASGDTCVYIDCTHLDMKAFKKHFPMIYERCLEQGIDLEYDWIPVAPSQHYICGGVDVNMNGQTSIKRLFGCGECTRTGLHGANRLASNSLLEALVYSDAIFKYLSEHYSQSHLNEKEYAVIHNQKEIFPIEIIDNQLKKLQGIMLKYVGIVRTDKELLYALKAIRQIDSYIDELLCKYSPGKKLYELKNMLNVGMLITQHSLNRAKSKGGFVKI